MTRFIDHEAKCEVCGGLRNAHLDNDASEVCAKCLDAGGRAMRMCNEIANSKSPLETQQIIDEYVKQQRRKPNE